MTASQSAIFAALVIVVALERNDVEPRARGLADQRVDIRTGVAEVEHFTGSAVMEPSLQST